MLNLGEGEKLKLYLIVPWELYVELKQKMIAAGKTLVPGLTGGVLKKRKGESEQSFKDRQQKMDGDRAELCAKVDVYIGCLDVGKGILSTWRSAVAALFT